VGGFSDNEIPLLASSLYLSNDGATAGASGGHPPSRQRILFWFLAISASSDKRGPSLRLREPLFRDIGQVGSLAGAAYLLYNNAGVLSRAQCEQKSHVEHKGKSSVDLDSQ